jgi:hypothetical protein
MPLGDIAGHFLVEVVLELLIKGPGYFIARLFKPGINPDSAWSIFFGLVFWAILGGLGYLAYLGAVS